MTPSKATWRMKEAEQLLGEALRRAREEGPQTITVLSDDSSPVAVSFTAETSAAFPDNLWEFFQRFPAAGIEFDADKGLTTRYAV